MELTLALVALAAVLAWVFKAFSGERTDTSAAPPEGAFDRSSRRDEAEADEPEPEDADEDELEDDGVHVAAMTSDGWSFVPMGHHVRLVAPRPQRDPLAPRSELGGLKGLLSGDLDDPAHGGGPRFERLDAGDLIGARVVRGAPDHDPWRLEALGRDRDYRAWRFETEEAAQAARALVEAIVVRPERDEYDEPRPLVAADFEAAFREHEEIERELAAMPDVEDPEERQP